jgi:hypothetical protein
MCFRGLQHQEVTFLGVIPSKLPRFSAGIGIFSFNVESNSFRTAGPILVICSSNDASPQKEFNYEGQAAKICFLGVSTKNSPKGVTQSNTLFYNFLTTQPIHKNISSINAVRQVQHEAKLKHVKNFDLRQK